MFRAIDQQFLQNHTKRINTIELPVTNDGTFGGVEAFMTLLEMYLVKLGVMPANVFSNQKQAKVWFETARSTLKHKSLSGLLKQMQKRVEEMSNQRKQAEAESKLPYFRNQPQRFAF